MVERQWKKVNGNTYDSSSIKRVPKKFLEVLRCSCAKQWPRIVQKKVCCTCKVAFANKNYCCFSPFSSVACLRRLALHDFVFCLIKL